MALPNNLNFLQSITAEAREQLVSKGVHVILFAIERQSGALTLNTGNNLLKGWPIGSLSGSGDNSDSEEYGDQLSGGIYKTFIGGGIDPGDITLSSYFDVDVGKPDIQPIVNSRVITPQFVLMLAIPSSTASSLDVVWSGGVNWSGGGNINGELGKSVKSELKFKVTGEPKVGLSKNGTIPYTYYTAGGSGSGGDGDTTG